MYRRRKRRNQLIQHKGRLAFIFLIWLAASLLAIGITHAFTTLPL